MLDPNSRPARALASGAIIVLAGCGIAMNMKFGWALGHDTLSRYLFTAMSVAADVTKILCLPFAVYHASKKRYAKAASVGVIWVLATSYCFASAFGFAGTTRSMLQSDHQRELAAYQQRVARAQKLELQVEDAKAAKNSRGAMMWETTGACLAATKDSSIAYCNNYRGIVADLERARKAVGEPPSFVADPQASLFATTFGIPVQTVTTSLAVAVAIFLETVSALSGFAFSKSVAPAGSGRRRRRKSRRRGGVNSGKVVAFHRP